MLSLKKVPWLSLTLVLLTQIASGRAIAKANLGYYIWLLAAIATLLIVKYLTSSLYKISTSTSKILGKLDAKSVSVAVLGAFLVFLMFAWFKVFIDTLLLFAAIMLVRIDFETNKLPQRQAFFMTYIFSLAGLALGALIERYLK